MVAHPWIHESAIDAAVYAQNRKQLDAAFPEKLLADKECGTAGCRLRAWAGMAAADVDEAYYPA
jgi:hypothetical protein